ncbi:MAG: L,D-transpeptidase family protein, partial [Pseudomonadota bacterium]
MLRLLMMAALSLTLMSASAAARVQITPFHQAMAQAASGDADIAAFYRARAFEPVWMGPGAADRRAAFLWALEQAAHHGLPTSRYEVEAIRTAFATADTSAAQGALDVRMTERFLQYAQDISTGIVTPKKVDPTIVLEVPRRDKLEVMAAFATQDPYAVVQSLWPSAPAYGRLLREKLRLEEMARSGGWGALVPVSKMEPGQSGADVVALRDRLIRMGYLERSLVGHFDAALEAAVRQFQVDHGLTPDGVVGRETVQAMNVPLEDRLAQVVIGLERQRWMNKPLEDRHILVNLAEQHAYVVDQGKVTFDTVVVVGAEEADRRTPEFSEQMTHLVVNPYWHVPRSIAVEEYLPALRRGGARHLEVHSSAGRVNPNQIDFSRYTARTFPYRLKQPPGPRNALGRVKFMFPNPYNIYLHDTPAKD